jgi:hypothetical protein
VPARCALEEHPVVLELQQVIVSIKAANHFADSFQDPFAQAFRRAVWATFALCRNRTGEIADHCSLLLQPLVVSRGVPEEIEIS